MSAKTEALYFKDINRFKLLSDEEERTLVALVQQNDKKAITQLITSNLRFVVSVARRYRGHGLNYLELINEGNLGLLKAAQRFDLNMQVKFISYGVWWIRQSIQKALYDQAGTIRIPPNKMALLNRFKKAMDANAGDFESTASQEEFRDYKQDIIDIREKLKGISMDAPIGMGSGDEDSTKTLQDVLGHGPDQDEESERKELGNILDSVMQNITAREERILRMYYGLNFSRQFTLDEIGQELKLTRERVRLIRDRSLRKLFHNPASRDKLYPFIATLKNQ
ncbi:MAG: RNA polymerase sigma factor RpoD/SigA [Chitinivibrionales bacterium]|nr:RNA polymerase sigma factor RpoD/SigA [Chitinivibrionales bacterium]